jgi:MHS family shikimate/dehydroshikimate transporter-like MFS transporter
MGTASTAIGLLPDYNAIGVAAPLLLVLLRAVQGFAVGGEWGGASLMAVEHAPRGKKALYGCVVQMGASAGLLLANGIFGLTNFLTSNEQFMSWGWRIPFLLSAVIVIAGYFIRRGVSESPEFEQVKRVGAEKGIPLLAAFREHPTAFLRIFGARFGELVGFYVVTSFLLAYATNSLGLSRGLILTATLVAAAGGLIANPLFAMLGDRVGWNRVYMGGSLVGVFAAVPLFWGVSTGLPIVVILVIALYVNVSHDSMVSVQQPLFAQMFGVGNRYSGAGFASQLASAAIAGTAPIIAIFLVRADNGGWTYLAGFLIVASLISVVAARTAPSGLEQHDAAPGIAATGHDAETASSTVT